MFDWLKGLFSPKRLIKIAVDSLDSAVPFIAKEIEKIKERFNAMDSTVKAQYVVDWVQQFLRKTFKLDT